MRRRAFTLVEIIFAAFILSVLFFVLWHIFYGGNQSFRRGADLSEALTGAMLLVEHLDADCRQMAVSEKQANRPMRIDCGGLRLTMTIASRARMSHDDGEVTKVVYAARATGKRPLRVRRNGRLLPQVYLESLRFEFIGRGAKRDSDMMFFRIQGVATDRFGRASFSFNRLLGLPGPSALAAREPAGEA